MRALMIGMIAGTFLGVCATQSVKNCKTIVDRLLRKF